MKNKYKISIFNEEGFLSGIIEVKGALYDYIDNIVNKKRKGSRSYKFRIVGLDGVDESIVFNSNAEAELKTGINHYYFTPYKVRL